jgi:hypothetical protein
VHAPQAIAPQGKRVDLGSKHSQSRPGIFEHRLKSRREVTRSKAIDNDVHLQSARRCARQRITHQAAGFIVGKDVGFEKNFTARRIERVDKSREILLTIR